jgi:hypothetical protein
MAQPIKGASCQTNPRSFTCCAERLLPENPPTLPNRNRHGDHPFAVTEARFHQFSSHFAAPTQAEGFTVVLHDDAP